MVWGASEKTSKPETVRSNYASLKAPLVKDPAHRPSSQKRKIHYVLKGMFAKLEFTGRRPRSDMGPKRRETRVHRHNCRSCKHAPKPLETKAENAKGENPDPSRGPNSLLLSEKRDQHIYIYIFIWQLGHLLPTFCSKMPPFSPIL